MVTVKNYNKYGQPIELQGHVVKFSDCPGAYKAMFELLEKRKKEEAKASD